MGWDNRSLFIFILLAILLTFPIAHRIGQWEVRREVERVIIPRFEREIERLEKWNEELRKSLLPMSPFPHPKKGGG